jgi:UDP-glucose 4-epimerase
VQECPPDEQLWIPHEVIRWSDRSSWREAFVSLVSEFANQSGTRSWRVWWCAGRGTISTTQDVLDDELLALANLLEALSAQPSKWLENGEFVFSSSAGSVYAGSNDLVISSHTKPNPISGYGSMKLRAEQMVNDFSQRGGTRSLVARITNLYGPRQDMSKSQGLISTICAALLKRQSIPIFVSLSTIRNYVFAEDAARVMWWRVREFSGSRQNTQIVCSPANLSVGAVLKICEEVTGVRPLVRFAARPDSAALSRSVYFDPTIAESGGQIFTPTHDGVARVYSSLLASWQRGDFSLDGKVA